MRDLTEENLTEAVLARTNAADPRVQELVTGLVRHLHAFVREVEPTEDELWTGLDFLTRVGQMCDDRRQEFILLSDMLGVTSLVNAINHRVKSGGTESTVTGPFHAAAPETENGAIIARGPEWERGDHLLVRGRVLDTAGKPIPGAMIDIWQGDESGHYDLQDATMPQPNLRGLFTTDGEGAYWFRSIVPASYPVPVDGPVGGLLGATGRHPMRPAHIHAKVTAGGYKGVTTHIFVEGDEHLESDAAFGVRESLVVDFVRIDSVADAAAWGLTAPFWRVDFDFVLEAG